MVDVPLTTIIQKIKEQTGLTDEEINSKIKVKLNEFSGLVSEDGAARIVANDLKVKLIVDTTQGPITIDKIMPAMRNIELNVKIKQKYEVREFNTGTRSGKVGNMLVIDETGMIRVVLWNDHADKLKELAEGDVINIKNVYARNNNGRTEIHFGDGSTLTKNPEGITVNVDITKAEQKTEAEEKKIADLTENDQNASVLATIVQVFDPRFFPACPQCNRKPQETPEGQKCVTHGIITPVFNSVMNLYLDDGTDNIRCVLWREQIEQLLKKTREELLIFKDEPEKFEVEKSDLLGAIVKVRGKINKNETFGRLELVAYEIKKDVELPTESKETKASDENKSVQEVEDVSKKETKNTENQPSKESEEKPKSTQEDELFTLDDIEDLETLED